MAPVTIFWFRRDLRIDDNRGFFHALKQHGNVLPLFIFDTDIIDKLPDKTDRRIAFIYEQLALINQAFAKKGSEISIKTGKPLLVFADLLQTFNISAAYANEDYEPYATKRDKEIKNLLSQTNVPFHLFKDQVIFEKDEVVKADGSPYTIFTPYSRKWLSRLSLQHLKASPSELHLDNLHQKTPGKKFDFAETGFNYQPSGIPAPMINSHLIGNYDLTRDIPALDGTTRLGVHLRFGTISIRRLVAEAKELNPTFLNELIWREFYMMILWHFPRVVDQSFKPQYDNIRWLNDEQHFEEWCRGYTGYPIVDAGMRQLAQTGYMHNRVRMIAASFLTKHLLTDWRWGEQWFADKLLDYELASNNGGWQWAAGTGCDAAPYFRVFNPWLQTQKFDPQQEYLRRWIPEIDSSSYPEPVVEHKAARLHALKAFKKALEK
jgi:deoxyribodipyrimidine photo-lyase